MDTPDLNGHMGLTTSYGQALFVFVRFEKYSPRDGQHRYLMLSLSPTLFGDWCVAQVSGLIGQSGGKERRYYCAAQAEAHGLFETLRLRATGRGFVPIPVQMGLF